MSIDPTSELLTAFLTATPDRKSAALKLLKGEPVTAAPPAAERFITITECGRQLGVSVCSLWRWGVPGHELGGRRRVRMSEVQAYLASDAFKRQAEILKATRRRELKKDRFPKGKRTTASAGGPLSANGDAQRNGKKE